jgi:hypothetical protein
VGLTGIRPSPFWIDNVQAGAERKKKHIACQMKAGNGFFSRCQKDLVDIIYLF